MGRWWGWLGGAYVAVCAVLAAIAVFAPDVSPWPFWVMVLLTLPMSLVAYWIQYIGFILLFGIEADGWFPATVSFLMWVGVAVVQVLAFRWAVRPARPPDPTAPAVEGRTG